MYFLHKETRVNGHCQFTAQSHLEREITVFQHGAFTIPGAGIVWHTAGCCTAITVLQSNGRRQKVPAPGEEMDEM